MRDEEPRIGVFRSAAQILAWVVTTAGALGVLALGRGLAQAITARIGVGLSPEAAQALRQAGAGFGWVATFTDMVITIVIACLGLAGVIFLEYYLRVGAARRQLLRRMLMVLGVEALLAGLFYGMTLLLV